MVVHQLGTTGTASLEATLLKRPMVVAYKLSPLTYWILRGMGVRKLQNFSLPNLLSSQNLMPEYLQGQVCAEVLGPALLDFLNEGALSAHWKDAFIVIHKQLRCNASKQAASAIIDLLMDYKDGS